MAVTRREWLYYSAVLGGSGVALWRILGKPSQLRLPTLSESLQRAGERAMPLLVFVIPEDATESWRCGVALGAFLNSIEHSAAWRLGLCEVACLPEAELRQVEGTFDRPLGDQPFITMLGPEVDASGKLRCVVLERGPVLGETIPGHLFSGSGDETEDQRIARQNGTITAFLVEQLNDSRMGGLSELVPRIQVDEIVVDESLSKDPSGLVAMLIQNWKLNEGETRENLERILATIARARFIQEQPQGALWTHSDGCVGATYEGIEYLDQNEGIACGMGSLHPSEARFLTFLTADNVGRFWWP